MIHARSFRRAGRATVLLSVPCLLITAEACGPKGLEAPTGPAETSVVVYPPAPDTARIQFLTRYGRASDIEDQKDQGSFLSSLLGQDPRDDAEQMIYKPYGVSMSRGRIYTCDTMLAGVVIMDLVGREMGVLRPEEDDAFMAKPINCATDPRDGKLYVADVGREEVLVYDSTLAYQGSIGAGDVMNKPVDVQVHGDRIWVADQTGHGVVLFDRETWAQVGKIPEYAPDDLEGRGVRQPTNIWVTDSELYVSDFGDFKIKVYTHDGTFVRSVGQYGRGLGMFLRPKGIAVDREGILYVVDAGFHLVQMFNEQGEMLMFFGGPDDDPGHMYLPAKVTIDYDNVDLFAEYVDPSYQAKYLILVTNQYGADKVNVYARVEPKAAGAEVPTSGGTPSGGPSEGGTGGH